MARSSTVTIKILADASSVAKASKQAAESLSGLDKFTGKLDGLSRGFDKLGDGFIKTGSSLTKKITAPIAGATIAAGGLVAALGWKRLKSLDTTKGQLEGLGYSGKQIDTIMTSVGAGIDGTSLSMAEGAAIANAALATNNLTLKDTEAYVRRVANISAAYPVDSAKAGELLNKVLLKNKVEYGDMVQMQENGIPVLSALADHYGVTGEEMEKMVKSGKVGIDDLNQALDTKAGAAAEAYGKTWEGMVAMVKANLGKIGAAMMGPTFDVLKERLADFLALLKSPEFTERAVAIGESIGKFVDDSISFIEKLIKAWNNLSPGVQGAIAAFAGFMVALGPMLIGIGKLFKMISTGITVIKLFATVLGLIFSPIGLIVAGIALVVAALVYFFTQTESGKKIWSKAWETIQKAIEVVKDWFVNTALPALSQAWDKIKEAASKAAEWFNDKVKPLFEAFGEFIIVYATMIGGVLSTIWDALKWAWEQVGEPILNTMKAIFETIWNNIVVIVETAIAVVTGVITAATALLKGDWGAAWEAIKGIFSTVWEAIKKIATNQINGVKKIIGTWIDWAKGYIQKGWDWIKDKTSSVWNSIKSAISSVWNAIKSAISSAVNSVKTAVSNAWNSVKTASSNAWNSVKTAVSNAWNSIKTAVSNAISNVVSTMRGLKGRVTGAISGAASWLFSAGRQIIQGLINGIKNMAGAAAGAARSVVSGAISGAKSLLGIRSPSRVFMTIGNQVGEGLVIGMDKMGGKVAHASADLSRDISRGFGTPNLSAPTITGNYGNGGGNTYNINVSVAPTADRYSIGREIKAAIDEYERVSG